MAFKIERRFRTADVVKSYNSLLSISSLVKYIPVYAIHFYRLIRTYQQSYIINDNTFIYPLISNKSNNVVSRYADFFDCLNGKSGLELKDYIFKGKEDKQDYKVFVTNSIVKDYDDSILMLLTVDNEYFMELYNGFLLDNFEIDYNRFKLFISRKFMTNQKFGYLWNKIEKEYYYDAIAKGIRVEIFDSHSIFQSSFNDGINLNFPTITEFENYLNNDLYESFIESFAPLETEEDESDENYQEESDEESSVIDNGDNTFTIHRSIDTNPFVSISNNSSNSIINTTTEEAVVVDNQPPDLPF